jgi:hypothetical protein
VTGPTHLDDDDDDLRLPGIEASPISDRSAAILLCTFRLCDWQSPDIRTRTLDEQDQLAARHLLSDHRRQLASLGQLAREHGLLP